MKLQTLALGLALATAGSAFAATHTTDVTRYTPNGVVHKHVVRTNDRDMDRHVVRKVVVRHPEYRHTRTVVVTHPRIRENRRVVIVHPAHHGHYAVNRTVVVHRAG
jgi:hypothetical protein